MSELRGVLDDLLAEGLSLDDLVASLPESGWSTMTPAEGWTIAHQIAHLAWTDDASILAATDAAGFQKMVTEAWQNPVGLVDEGAEALARTPPAELLARWRAGRTAVASALADVPAGEKLPWFGPPMSAMSMATARIMETWAHGLDIADALGVERPPTTRLRHVTHISVRTRDFAFQLHGLTPPAEPFHVALTAPDGSTWTWGPADAAQKVTGPALDLCLVATQRRHRADTALVATGPDADKWLDIAQAFAGLPGPGRKPSQ
ncbi:TIGR03084 family metal-binding protein [Kibdelosporangium persicum]|uniref:Mycothiol-dependent maleylpyruvate isomerase n=1 Tax=Kibdelosporangium persicum TaxID=2698649 RepID=A0ABX2FI19_9PSEU|nr:TIGR03084 family metal-binding protein [Kibdelosporangium persicum]NRN70517.1 Mycothiol-dependent maleylpyruvate isomerase [Kibdelosporangium persicum]